MIGLSKLKRFFRGERDNSRFGGFDISDHSIEYVAVAKEEGNINIKLKDRLVLPDGIMEEGVIKDAAGLVKLMRGVSSGASFPEKISIGIGDRIVYMHVFSVHKPDAKNLKVVVQEEMKQTIPAVPSELVFDYFSWEEGDVLRVLVAAVEKKYLEPYISVAERLGLRDVVFEPESLALVRSIVKGDEEKTASLVVDFGFRYTGLYLAENGNIQLVSGLRRGGEEITDAIADKFKVSKKEAELRKIKLGFKDSELLLILQFIPQLIIQEIMRMVGFYEKNSAKKVERILLVGGGSLIPGMAEYFSRNVEKPVLLLAHDERILYSAAIGLAMRGFDSAPSINLYREFK